MFIIKQIIINFYNTLTNKKLNEKRRKQKEALSKLGIIKRA